MDAVDYKLLTALIKDSRASLTQIGKAAGIARENVHYRIQKLVREKTIRSFVTHIDYHKLGFEHFTLFVQYGKITESEERALLDVVRSHQSLSWIGVLAGKTSLTVDLYAQSLTAANRIADEFLEKFAVHIENYHILHNETDEFFLEKLVGGRVKSLSTREENYAVDEIDLTILRVLADESRASYVELGEKTKLSANGIKKRILALERQGVILQYSVSLDHRAFGFEWHGIQVKVSRPDTKARQRFAAFCREHPKILFVYCYSRTGEHDYDVGVIVKNSRELRDFINDFRAQFSDWFTIIDIFLVLEEFTSHSLPPAVFSVAPKSKNARVRS